MNNNKQACGPSVPPVDFKQMPIENVAHIDVFSFVLLFCSCLMLSVFLGFLKAQTNFWRIAKLVATKSADGQNR